MQLTLTFLLWLLIGYVECAFIWDTVKIGGGGYVIGVTQSKNGTIYIRTDVGGIYRFNHQSSSWKPLLDFLSINKQNLFGTDGFVTSPYHNDVIYTASGMYEFDTPSYILKSIDTGNSFKQTNGTFIDKNGNVQKIIIGGNEDLRWSRSRLCIHPDPNKNKIAGNETIYFGTRLQSLLYTQNGGDTWKVVESFPFKNSTTLYGYSGYHLGIIFVNINPFNYNIYVSLYNYGIYYSNDNGDTWNIIKSDFNLTICLNSRFNTKYNDNRVYFACESGVFVYNETSKIVSNITPLNNEQYCGMDISTNGKIIVTNTFSINPNKFFYSQIPMDGTTNYKWQNISTQNRHASLPWTLEFASHSTALICHNIYDDCRRIAYGDFFQTWFNDDIYNDSSLWYTKEDGHEEVFVFILATPPMGAPVFSGLSDTGGFRHSDVTQYPDTLIDDGKFSQSFMGMDFCETNPNVIVAVAGGEGYKDMNHTGIYSLDNGITWTEFESAPPGVTWTDPVRGFEIYYSGKIYINPQNCSQVIWIPLNNVPYVSYNMGQTWTKSKGAPVNTSGTIQAWKGNGEWNFAYPMYIMNDRKNGNYLYMYHYESNTFYITKNGGMNWVTTNVKLVGVKNSDGNDDGNGLYGKQWAFQGGYLSTDFAKEGRLCICFGFNGLYCSTNYGYDFNKIDGIYIARMVTFGRSKNSMNESNMYLFGLTDNDKNNGINDEGLYIIEDISNKNSFIRMTNSSYQLGDHSFIMMGDRQTYGRVYVGSQGRGIYYSTFVN